VGRAVVGVSVHNPVVDRDRPVGGDGEDPEELLEVGAVVFAVAPGRLGGALPPHRPTVGPPVESLKGDRGRVIVEAVQFEAELPDGTDHDLGEEGGAVGVEEGLQGPPEPVVVEEGALLKRHSEEVGSVGVGPGRNVAERFPGDQKVPEEDE